jgi:hypothetical protein
MCVCGRFFHGFMVFVFFLNDTANTQIYTNSLGELRDALDRRVDKEMALDATSYSQDQTRPLREESARDASLHHEQPGTERSSDQAVMGNDHAQLNATNDVAQNEEMEFDLA